MHNLWIKLLATPRNPRNPNFPPKNYLFLVKLVRKAVKSTFTYNGLGLAFHGKCSWSSGNDIARNVLIFVLEKSKKR